MSQYYMRKPFPLFQSHLDLAHTYWSQSVQVGDTVIDATCGNGHDTLKLCQLALTLHKGKVYAFDNQEIAINSTRHYVENHLSPSLWQQIDIQQHCHSVFPYSIPSQSIKLIVYNLGYLPGSNKHHTTQTSTTLQSLIHAEKLLTSGGLMSITCYPGHEEGVKEQASILTYASSLSPKHWSCCHHVWLNRRQAPSLILIQKAED